MKLNVTPGFVFWYLYDTSRQYFENGYPPLEKYLGIDRTRLLRWFCDEEPINEKLLNKALEAFGRDRDTYDFLCTL